MTVWKGRLAVFTLFAGIVGAACSATSTSDCNTYCENASAATQCAPEFLGQTSCPMLCTTAQFVADGSGCDVQYSALTSCGAGLGSNACALLNGNECRTQLFSFAACKIRYCKTHGTKCELVDSFL
jgi:hypothetical protein